ncbi:MAG: J domain-containing protein [Dehalococcoidia bacterium]
MAKQPEAASPFQDYYQVLHLQPEADAAMLDQAYWHLARLYNAAIPTDSDAKERLDELNEAYSVLRSPSLRKEYDRVRDTVIARDLMPLLGKQEPQGDPLPLTIMGRKKARARADSDDGGERQRPTISVPRVDMSAFRAPVWQSFIGAVVIVTIAGAALASGLQPALVIGLASIGLGLSMLPLIRSLPSWPVLPRPALNLPTIKAPKLPERSTLPSMDADSLRRETEAMRARWRQGDNVSPLDGPPPGMPSSWTGPQSQQDVDQQ